MLITGEQTTCTSIPLAISSFVKETDYVVFLQRYFIQGLTLGSGK